MDYDCIIKKKGNHRLIFSPLALSEADIIGELNYETFDIISHSHPCYSFIWLFVGAFLEYLKLPFMIFYSQTLA